MIGAGRLQWIRTAFFLFNALAVIAAHAQAPSEDNLHPRSEDNMGVMTEDGVRTTQSGNPPANIGAGSTGGAGRAGSGSTAAAQLANEFFVGSLATAPLVAADRNLLIGRWHASGGTAGTDLSGIGPLGEMAGGMLSGGCESMFGKEVTFGPASFERLDHDGRIESVQHVEYHGTGSTIAVLLKGSGAQPMVMRLPDPDHAVSAMGCTLQREETEEERRQTHNATLQFQAGIAGPGAVTPLVNASLWVMMQDPQATYLAAGLPLPDGVSLQAKIASDCRSVPVCLGEIVATVKGALGRVMTDAQGHAQTPPMRPGAYYVVGVSASQGKPLIWVLPVVLQPGLNTVTLNQVNGRSPR